MKIYISGSLTHQARLRERGSRLFKAGHEITSTWLNEAKKPLALTEEQWYSCLALKDLTDLAKADCIILDTEGVSTTGGRYVEWGFALAQFNMLKVIVGPPNIRVFNALADKSFTTWDEVFHYFESVHKQEEQK